MRTLRKTLCLVLALVMILGLGAFSVSADDDETAEVTAAANTHEDDYATAIAVMGATGLMIGGEGVDWTQGLNRQDVAVILARLGGLKDSEAANFAATCSYTDVTDANYRGYIGYAEAQGYIKGYGDGTFGFGDILTGYQFALMLLRVLGYKDANENITATNWQVRTATLARTAGLDVDLENIDQQIDRSQAAQFAFNALQADLVEYESDGATVTIGDTTVTTGSKRIPYTDDGAKGSDAISDEEYDNKDIIQLGEALFEGDLVYYCEDNQVNGGAKDAFGRPVAQWTYDNEVVAETEDSAYSLVATYTANMDTTAGRRTILNNLKGYYFGAVNGDGTHTNSNRLANAETTVDNTAVDVYANDATTSIKPATSNPLNAGETIVSGLAKLTGNGTLVEVYANSYKEITSVVQVKYTLDTVKSVSTNAAGDKLYTLTKISTILRDYADNSATDDTIVLPEGIAVAAKDVVTVAKIENSGALTGTAVCYVYPTDTITGTLTSVTGTGATRTVALDGKTYAMAACYDANSTFTVGSTEYNYYVDQYGYMVSSDAVTTTAKTYVAITKAATETTSGLDSGTTYKARILPAGETSTTDVTVTALYGTDGTTSLGASAILDYEGAIASYTTSSGRLTLEATGTATSDAIATNGTASVKYGSATATTSASTVFMVRSWANAQGTSYTYGAYTGYGNLPTLAAKSGSTVAVKTNNNGYATYVYIDYAGRLSDTTSTSTAPVLYVADNEITQTGASVYELNGYVNGTLTKLTAASASTLATVADGFYTVTYNTNGTVNKLEAIDRVYTVTSTASGVITANGTAYTYGSSTRVYTITDGVLASGEAADAEAGDTVCVFPTTGDGTALSTLYILKATAVTSTVTTSSAETAQANTATVQSELTDDKEVTVTAETLYVEGLTVSNEQALTVNNLSIASGETVTVADGGKLVVNGTASSTTSNDGEIVVEEGGTLEINTGSDDATINAHIEVEANAESVTINGATADNKYITIAGTSLIVAKGATVTINGNVKVTGNVIVAGGEDSSEYKTAGGTLAITGDLLIDGASANFIDQGTVTVGGDFTLTNANDAKAFGKTGVTIGYLAGSGTESDMIAGSLTVTGESTFTEVPLIGAKGTFTAKGGLTTAAVADMDGEIIVTGGLTASGDIASSSTTTYGTVSIDSAAAASFDHIQVKNVTLTGGKITGAATLGSKTMTVSGNTEFTITLTTAAATAADAVEIKSGATLQVDGALTTAALAASSASTIKNGGTLKVGSGATESTYKTLAKLDVTFTGTTVEVVGGTDNSGVTYTLEGKWLVEKDLQLGTDTDSKVEAIVELATGATLTVEGKVDLSKDADNAIKNASGNTEKNKVVIKGIITPVASDANAQITKLPVGAYIVKCDTAGQVGQYSSASSYQLVIRYTAVGTNNSTDSDVDSITVTNTTTGMVFEEDVAAKSHATNKFFYITLNNFAQNDGGHNNSAGNGALSGGALGGDWAKGNSTKTSAAAGDYTWSTTNSAGTKDSGEFTISSALATTLAGN